MSAIARIASIFFLASVAQLAVAAPVEERSKVTAAVVGEHVNATSFDIEERGNIYGDATYYNTGLGSCGWWSQDTDYIVAVNWQQMANGANPNNNPNCGKWINVWGPKGFVRVFVVDTCPGCAYGALDLSPAAFDKIADRSQGRVKVWWNWS